MVEVYSKTIINFVWFLQIERTGDGRCTVTLLDRLHLARERERMPEAIGSYEMEEGEGRVLVAVSVTKRGQAIERLVLDNPHHVFSYPGFS